MSQENTLFFNIVIPDGINRNWHPNDHLLKRIVGEKFPDINIVIRVDEKLSPKMKSPDFNEHMILFVFDSSSHSLVRFAKEHINDSRVIIFTDFLQPKDEISPEAANNPRVHQIKKGEISYTTFENAMEILVPTE